MWLIGSFVSDINADGEIMYMYMWDNHRDNHEDIRPITYIGLHYYLHIGPTNCLLFPSIYSLPLRSLSLLLGLCLSGLCLYSLVSASMIWFKVFILFSFVPFYQNASSQSYFFPVLSKVLL